MAGTWTATAYLIHGCAAVRSRARMGASGGQSTAWALGWQVGAGEGEGEWMRRRKSRTGMEMVCGGWCSCKRSSSSCCGSDVISDDVPRITKREGGRRARETQQTVDVTRVLRGAHWHVSGL